MDQGERMGRIEERVATLERDTGGLRSEIGALRVDLLTRHETLRNHMDVGLEKVSVTVRADLAAHMAREEDDQKQIRTTLARIDRWRWTMMGAVGLLAWGLGIAVGIKWW